jgi:thiol-disulfide isomerase/thioredoxin
MEKVAAVAPKEKVFVNELVEKDYEAEVLRSAMPVVLDFYSNESEPCKALAPRFGAVAEKFDGKLRFMRILRQSNTALSEKLSVTLSPTLVFFKGGKEFGDRLSGVDIKRTELKEKVEALLK